MKINGERCYLWRAVDHEGEVLESYVTKEQDKAAARAFNKKAMKRPCSPGKTLRSAGGVAVRRGLKACSGWGKPRP